MKKLNKKGFTLVEILATIALLGVVMLIAVGSFNVIKKKVLERQYKAVVTSLYSAGNKYYNNTGEIAIYVKDLVDLGYIEADKNDKFIDPVNGFDMAGGNLFLLMKENPDKYLFYFNEKKERKTYTHDIASAGKDFYYLPLKEGIETYAKGKLIDEGIDDSKWTNGDILLKYEPGELNSQILGGETNLKYSWYSSYDSYKTVGTKEEFNIDSDDIGKVYEDEYTLVVENEEEETKKVFTKKIHIDKINPKIETTSLIAGVHITVSDKESGVDYTKFKIYSCDEFGVGRTIYPEDKIKLKPLTSGTFKGDFQLTDFDTGYYIFEISDIAGNTNRTVPVHILKNDKCYARYGDSVYRYSVPTDEEFTIGAHEFAPGIPISFTMMGQTHIGFTDEEGKFYKKGHTFTSEEIGELCERYKNEIKFNVQYDKNKIIYYVNSPSSYKAALITHDVTKGSFSNGEETYTQTLKNYNFTFVIRSAPENLPYYKFIGQVNLDFIGWRLSPSNTGTILYPGTKIEDNEFRGLLREYYSYNNISTADENGTVKLFGVYDKNDIDITFNTNGCGTINGSNTFVINAGKNEWINFKYINFSPEDKLLKWCTSKNCDGCGNDEYSVDNSHKFSSDTTLYAQCEKETPPPGPETVTYSITYDANGGTFKDEKCNGLQQCIISNISGPTQIIADTPTKANYVFAYWCDTKNCDSTSKKYISGDEYKKKENIIFYAQYIEMDDGYIPDDDIPDDIPDEEEQTTASTTYTITYDANGGKFTGEDGCIAGAEKCVKDKLTGSQQITSAVPQIAGKTFDKWSTNKIINIGATEYKTGDYYTGGESITLYARYTTNPKYDVKYDWGNCELEDRDRLTISDDHNIPQGTTYTVKSAQKCDHSEFAYWLGDDGEIYMAEQEIKIYKDLVLNAYFNVTEYVVTYKTTLPIYKEKITVKLGDSHKIKSHNDIEFISDPDYEFVYWYTNDWLEETGRYYEGNLIYPNSDITLHSKYYKYRFNVTYKCDGKKLKCVSKTEKYNSDKQFTVPSLSIPENYDSTKNIQYSFAGTYSSKYKSRYTGFVLLPLGRTYYQGLSYDNPTSKNNDLVLTANASGYEVNDSFSNNNDDENVITKEEKQKTKCTISYYDNGSLYSNQIVYCNSDASIIDFVKTYTTSKGKTKKLSLNNWNCEGQSKMPGNTIYVDHDITCTANYTDICQYDQDHKGMNVQGEANQFLFTDNTVGSTSNSTAACYKNNGDSWSGGKVSRYKVCTGDQCGILKGQTAEDINKAYYCNYNIYHCTSR